MRLYCMNCQQPTEFTHASGLGRNWITDEDECETCHTRGKWRTENDPKVAWDLNHNDRSLLKAIKIDPDE